MRRMVRLGKETVMDNTTLVRVIAGVCFLVVLVFLVMRRRKKAE